MTDHELILALENWLIKNDIKKTHLMKKYKVITSGFNYDYVFKKRKLYPGTKARIYLFTRLKEFKPTSVQVRKLVNKHRRKIRPYSTLAIELDEQAGPKTKKKKTIPVPNEPQLSSKLYSVPDAIQIAMSQGSNAISTIFKLLQLQMTGDEGDFIVSGLKPPASESNEQIRFLLTADTFKLLDIRFGLKEVSDTIELIKHLIVMVQELRRRAAIIAEMSEEKERLGVIKKLTNEIDELFLTLEAAKSEIPANSLEYITQQRQAFKEEAYELKNTKS
jgi:hypothetical protein